MTTNGLNLDLSAGFARIDITPSLGTPIVGYFKERRAKGILDPLEANALALSDGERTAVVIAADLLGIEGIEFNAMLRRRIAQSAGIEEDAVYVHSTHTHTGPGAGVSESWRTDAFSGTASYNEFLAYKLADVARRAVKDMSPATLETGVAEAERMILLENGPTSFDMTLSMLTLGDSVALFGIPGEPFTEIGRAIRAQSPFKTTICTCLTNGSLGYFPTASAFAEGGYEAKSSPFASSVAERIVAGLAHIIKKSSPRLPR